MSDSLASVLASLPDTASASTRVERFRLVDDEAIEHTPPIEYRIAGVLPVGSFLVLYGPPETWKTWWMLMCVLSVATGFDFFGARVKRGLVVYVAAEGVAGIGARMRGLKRGIGWDGRAGIYFLTEPVQLLEPASVAAFLTAIATLEEPPALIVFDTLARCLVGGDENSSRDMGLAVQACDTIRRATGAAVALVHHTRKDGDGERGSTALRGAADVMVSLKREGDQVVVTNDKMKDGPHFPPYRLVLVPSADSCTLKTASDSDADSVLIPSDPAFQVLRILHDSSLEDGLSTSAWLAAAEMKDRAFYAARKRLLTMGYVDKEPGKRGRNLVTDDGVRALTGKLRENCGESAPHVQSKTTCTPPSLRRLQFAESDTAAPDERPSIGCATCPRTFFDDGLLDASGQCRFCRTPRAA